MSVPFFARERVKSADFFVDTNFKILHEDDHILVVNKPAPLAVHPVGSYSELNLHTLLKKDPRWADTKIHFTHRLDAETSGVILIAKNHDAARFIGIEFLNGRVRKKYHALVFGTPKDPEGEIDLTLGHDESSGFQTVRTHDPVNGETALTRYRLISVSGDYSYLEVTPLTGRTHQIRAHLSFIGHPIVGDKIYIDLNIFRQYVLEGLNPVMLERLRLPRLGLHASELVFTHPFTKREVRYACKAPDFLGMIKQ